MTFNEIEPGMLFVYPYAIPDRRIWLAGKKTLNEITFFFAQKHHNASKLHYDELAIVKLSRAAMADKTSMWPDAKPSSLINFRSFSRSAMRDVFLPTTKLYPHRRKK